MDADVQMLEIARLNDEFRRVLPTDRVIVHRQIQHWSRMCEVVGWDSGDPRRGR